MNKMKFVVVLSILILIQAEASQDDILINGVPYHREILRENVSSSYYYGCRMAVIYNTNDLYSLAYDNDTDSHKLNVFNINTREHRFISGIKKLQSVTVDQVTEDVYVMNSSSSSSNIYRYNEEAIDTLELVKAFNYYVWDIYFKEVLYYTKFSSGRINILVNRKSALFKKVDYEVNDFVIDNEDNVVYLKKFKLYYHPRGEKHVFYERLTDVRSLTRDRKGKVYFTTGDGIYEFKNDSSIERIASIDSPREIVFDNENNIIYYSTKDHKLYRLKRKVDTVNATDLISRNNVTNSYSDQELAVTSNDNNNIKTELQTINKRIDSLQQAINILTNNKLEQLLHTESNLTRTIHLENVVLKNINITIGEAEVVQGAQLL